MTQLLCIANLDAWKPQAQAARLAARALQGLAVFESRRATRSGPEPVLILGPESLKASLAPICQRYATYVDEFAQNRWDDLLEQGRRISAAVGQSVQSIFADENERRYWRSIEPWFAHKITFRHLSPRAMLLRLAAPTGQTDAARPVKRPLKRLVDAIDAYFERRERETIWRQLLDPPGRQPVEALTPVQVLLLSAGVYAPRVTIPLARKLRSENLSTHLLTSAGRSPWPFDPGLSTDGLSWSYFFSIVPREEALALRRALRTRAQRLSQAASALPLPSEVPSDLRNAVRDELLFFLQEDWTMAGCFDRAVNANLDRLKPGVVILTKNLRVMEGVLAENAHARDIPVIFLDTAILPNDVDHLRLDPRDHVVAAGPQSVPVFQRLGAHQENIHPFGDFRFDRLLSRPTAPSTGLFKDPGRFAVLAVGETIGEATAEAEITAYYQAIVELQKRYPQLDILLKLHPKQPPQDYQRQAAAWGLESLRWVKDANTYDLICEASAVLTHMSQAGVESLFLRKPLFIYLAESSPEKLEAMARINMSVNPDYATLSTTTDDLLGQVGRFVSDPQYRREMEQKAARFRSDFYYNTDVPASERLAQLVAQMTAREAVRVS